MLALAILIFFIFAIVVSTATIGYALITFAMNHIDLKREEELLEQRERDRGISQNARRRSSEEKKEEHNEKS